MGLVFNFNFNFGFVLLLLCRHCFDLATTNEQLQHTSTPKSNNADAQLVAAAYSEELFQLKTINIFSDTFIIGITHHGIGTINSLRLGRRPEEAVEWDEINAAWGQCVLLLHILAKKLGFTFSKYRPIPMGARPYIQLKVEHEHHQQYPPHHHSVLPAVTYPLYGSPAVTFSRSAYFYEFWGTTNSTSNFDLGMEGFLFCVSELCARMVSLSSTVTLPY
jgi:beclin 1